MHETRPDTAEQPAPTNGNWVFVLNDGLVKKHPHCQWHEIETGHLHLAKLKLGLNSVLIIQNHLEPSVQNPNRDSIQACAAFGYD